MIEKLERGIRHETRGLGQVGDLVAMGGGLAMEMLVVPQIRAASKQVKQLVIDEAYLKGFWSGLKTGIERIIDTEAESMIVLIKTGTALASLRHEAAVNERRLATRGNKWRSRETALRYPWSAFRSTVLYSLFPADESVWYQLFSRPKTVWNCVFLISYAGVNHYAFILIFFLIDRRDEYQLVQYITNFRVIQFVFSGCVPLILLMINVFMCIHVRRRLPAERRARPPQARLACRRSCT